jgi:hypothetical protein
MAMLADEKLRKEIEIRQLRTRSTNEREQKKAELKELTRLLSEARTSEQVSRDGHDVVSAKLVTVTLEMMKAHNQMKELQEQLEICDRNEQNDTPNLVIHLNKIRKGRGKWGTMALELSNVKHLKGYFLKKSALYIRDNIYTARMIGRIIDLNHGINLSGTDALRTAEAGRSTHQKILWSSGTINACYRDIERAMSSEIPITEVKEMREGKLVEGVKFDTKKLFAYLVRYFGLDEYAKNGSVEMDITVDAAQLDDNSTHVTIGFKIVDKRERDLIKKILIYSELQNMQSGQWCFPIMTFLAKDSKNTYNHFLKPIFDECE